MDHSTTTTEELPWNRTPLLYATSLSERLGHDIYIKLETLQPTQNFKHRSEGNLVHKIFKQNGPDTHFVIASGGNAALALATAAYDIGAKCSVFIPTNAAKPLMLAEFKRVNAEVVAFGTIYAQALEKAVVFAQTTPNAFLASPYDHELLWLGASSMIDEVAEQLPKNLSAPDAIVASVGGGSLIGGVLLGCERYGWDKTKVVGVEAVGSDCLYHTVLASEDSTYVAPDRVQISDDPEQANVKLATVTPTSRATSLGASFPASVIVKKILDRRQADKGSMTVVNIPDELTMVGCLNFADDYKILVELACGAALAPLYDPALFEKVFGVKPADSSSPSGDRKTLVFIACGGFKISLAEMFEYRAHLDQVKGRSLEAFVDGQSFEVQVD